MQHAVDHKSLTKCSCTRLPHPRTHKPDPRPTSKFRRMAGINRLRAKSRESEGELISSVAEDYGEPVTVAVGMPI